MDRIELALEKLISGYQRIVDSQEEFTVAHKQLLTSQVLLTDRVDKLAEAQKATDAQMKETDARMKETDARLSILIGMMDTFIRERGHT